MRRIITLFIIGLIIVTNIPALSEVTKGEFDKLTDSERSSLGSTVDIACFASKGSTKSSYCTSIFDIDLSNLSADELESIKDYLDGKTDDNPSYANASVESREKLIDTEDFLLKFNFCAALLNSGHVLSTENSEISRLSETVLLKTIFNGCEVLSLNLTPDSKEVITVHCSWSISIPGSSKYSDDFIYLLMESLNACGMEADTISDVLLKLGGQDAYNIGDSNDVTINGIKVRYEVTSATGVSFTIERT